MSGFYEVTTASGCGGGRQVHEKAPVWAGCCVSHPVADRTLTGASDATAPSPSPLALRARYEGDGPTALTESAGTAKLHSCCTNPRRAHWSLSKGGVEKAASRRSPVARPALPRRRQRPQRPSQRTQPRFSQTALCNSHGAKRACGEIGPALALWTKLDRLVWGFRDCCFRHGKAVVRHACARTAAVRPKRQRGTLHRLSLIHI